MSRSRARQRCTRESRPRYNEHAQVWANPAATASSTVLQTSSLTSAGTRAGPARSAPTGLSPHDRQLDSLGFHRLGQRLDLRSSGFELLIAFRTRASRLAGERGKSRVFDREADADHRRHVHRHLRAASARVISPAAICRKISHFVSADRLVGRRRPLLDSGMNCSSGITREDCQPWAISHPDLCREVRRKTARACYYVNYGLLFCSTETWKRVLATDYH